MPRAAMRSPLLKSLRSAAPARPTIVELRAEFKDRGMEGWLWPWLAAVLMASVIVQLRPRYAADVYSPTGEWDDEGMSELVVDFVLERGVKRGAIALALVKAESTAGVERYLEVALHRYAISERRRSVASNIYGRLVEVLETDATLRPLAGFGLRAAYGLDEWSDDPPMPVDGVMVHNARRFVPSDVRWAEYSTGSRRSPGLLSEDLRRIAHAVIRGSQGLWTADQIMDVIESRFNLELEDPDRPIRDETVISLQMSPLPSALDDAVAQEIAQSAVERLSGRQRRILHLMAQDQSLGARAIAERLGRTKSLVNNEQHAIRRMFSELPLVGIEERMQVLTSVSSLLSETSDAPSPDAR
jgi:hypothetical protein